MLGVTAVAVLAFAQGGSAISNPTLYYCSGAQSELSNWNQDPVQVGSAQTAVFTVSSPECVLGGATYLTTTNNSATSGTITLTNPNGTITIPTTAQAASPGFVNMVGTLPASPAKVVTAGTVSCANDNTTSRRSSPTPPP